MGVTSVLLHLVCSHVNTKRCDDSGPAATNPVPGLGGLLNFSAVLVAPGVVWLSTSGGLRSPGKNKPRERGSFLSRNIHHQWNNELLINVRGALRTSNNKRESK